MKPVVFDDGDARALRSALEAASERLRDQGVPRRSAVETAVEDFSGRYARLFTDAANAELGDRVRLARVMEDVADAVLVASYKAQDERRRQKDLAAWQERQKAREALHAVGGFTGFATDVVGVFDGQPSQYPVACPPVSASFAARPRHRAAGGGDGAGKSSADPEKLRGFVSQAGGANHALEQELSHVQKAWSKFRSSCSWVGVESASFLTGFQHYLNENKQDVTWIGQIADAFDTVGHGVSLSNSVLNQVGTRLGQLNLSSPSKRMALLKNSTPDELKQLLLIDPALAQSFWDRPPDSADVAAWWATLSQAQRDALVKDAAQSSATSAASRTPYEVSRT